MSDTNAVEKPYIQVKMPDGSVWAVPARIVAESYATHYASADPDSNYRDEYSHALQNASTLLDWAANNMNWSQVKLYAVKLEVAEPVNYQEGWVNGEKAVVR